MPKSVVLIDDDEDDLDVLQEAIVAADPSLVCLAFSNPVEAIDALTKDLILIPDYVFTDINMPGLTGQQCIQHLRLLEDYKATVITVLSTSMPDDVAQRLKEIGANHTFQKPVSIEHYQHILTSVFKTA